MYYKMNLHDEPFNSIKNGSKTIELRLNDEKRQLLKVNDEIEFTNRLTQEKLVCTITALYKFQNFSDLYKHFDKISLGYKENELANPKDMEKYYSQEEQEHYGVLAIKIKVKKEL